MRAGKVITAFSALAGAVTFGLGVPSASASVKPWQPGTIFVADQGSRTGVGGVFAITPSGARTTLFNAGTAVDVAGNAAGDVFAASCNLGAVVRIPADHSPAQWLASGLSCPDAVAVEPDGDVIFAAQDAIYRVPADGSAAPDVVVPEQNAASLAEDDNGDIWLADGSGHLRVVVAGTHSAVTVDNGTDYADEVRSVRFAANSALLVATAFGEGAVRYAADLHAATEVAAAGGYTTGAVYSPAKSAYYVADDTNRRIVSQSAAGQAVFVAGLDDPRGLDIYPAVRSAARMATTTVLTTTAPSSVRVYRTVVLQATVTGGATPQHGLVQFSIDGRPLGTATPVRNGVATLRTTLPAGPDEVTATYLGSTDGAPSQSDPINFTVGVAPTTTTLTSSTASSAPQSEDVQLSVDVASDHGTPDGLAEIQVDGRTVAGAALDGEGHGDVAVTLTPGTHQVRAVYFGDGSYFGPSRSQTLTFDMTAPYAPTLDAVVSTGEPNEDGTVPVAIGVTVRGFAGRPVPTGALTADPGYTCGALTPAAKGVRATATCTGTVVPGFYEVGLHYGGDANYAAADTSATVFVLGGGIGG